MPKIKIDVGGVSDDEAKAWGGGFESPQPGVYRAKITEVNPGYSKDDNGEPDRAKPKLEVVFEIVGPKYNGANLWNHIPLPGSTTFGDSAKKKMKQLLLATGQKATDSLDTDKVKNKIVRVRVRSGKDQSGDYRGEFAAMFRDDDDAVKLTAAGEGSSSSGDEELLTGDEELIEDDASSEEATGTDWDARLEELMAMQGADLQNVAREWKAAGWDIKIGGKKADVAAAVVAVEQEAAAQEEANGGDAEEALIEDEELIIEEDESLPDDDSKEYLTEEQLKAMTPADLMALGKADFDIDAKAAGLKTKSDLVTAILAAQAAPSGDDEEVLPF